MKIKTLIALTLVSLITSVAIASVGVRDDGAYKGEATTINFKGATVSFDGSQVTVDTEVVASVTAAEIITTDLTVIGDVDLSNSGNQITLLGKALTVSGTDLFWGGKQVTN